MNTDKLMQLVEKWREESTANHKVANDAHDRHDLVVAAYRKGLATADKERADELAAAIRAEQAVGDEQRARELLAECLEGLNATSHGPALEGSLRDRIARALGTARQSEGVVLVPKRPTEAMLEAGRDAVMARDCSSNEWGPADHYEAAGISRKGMPDHLFEGKGKMSKAWGAELVYAAMLAAAPGGEGEG